MPRLLIVSDELPQRLAVRDAAAAVNYRAEEMTCPESWEEAVRAQAGQPFRVAVVDIQLWGRLEGGVDYIRQLHVEQPSCLIVALTGQRGDESGVRAMRAGAADFINADWPGVSWIELLKRKLELYRHLSGSSGQGVLA